MALDERQTILYTDVFDVYKPVALMAVSGKMPNNDVKALRYPATPTTVGVNCFHRTVGKLGLGKFYGRQSVETTTANTDTISFDQAADVDVNYCLQKKTPNDPELGDWFIVEAKRDINNFLANKMVVYVRRITKPPGVT